MRTQRLIAYAFALCLASLLAGSAMADDHPRNPSILKGTYRHMVSGSCATSDAVDASGAGFTPFPFLQAIGSGSTGPGGFTGVITYDGKGNATETLHGIGLSDGPYGAGTFPVLTYEETCDWTYVVNRDFSFIRKGICHGKTTSGQFVGSPYTLSDIEWVGQIGIGGAVLITNSVEPVEQKLSNGFLTKRICASQGTEVRIRQQ
jgi:hypothetical protein